MLKLTNLSFPLMLVIRAIQGIFALLVLILSAFVANWYNTSTSYLPPSQINFLIFAAVWSLISIACIELVPRFVSRIPKAYIAAPLDLTNALFYLAGFAALAAFLNGLLFCRGDVCHAAQAAVAFGAFSFAAWTASAALTCLELFKARRGSIRSPRAAAATSSSPGMKEAA
ncbi:membrane-associating domain-containing protein [Corynascus novoguineensis]|uniref:Membrane-associating domain-containing protein n=1 Tax=Corynascus novoguineensis TaxID=1126955 RepID=A0AAN7CWZ6_9PEZI|nr:membrane-associating domain-containing protein [Corynascus novoguineensis]